MKIYLAGHAPQLKGSSAQFLRASELLRGDYHEVFPTLEQAAQASDRLLFTEPDVPEYDFRGELSRNLAWICSQADRVLVLPTFRDTAQGRAEFAAARALHIPVHSFTAFILDGDLAERLTA